MRGESVIASTGIALAAILLAAMGANAWWTVHVQSQAAESTRLGHLRAVGTLLAQSAEGMLTQDRVADARRLVAEALGAHQLNNCTLTLSNGEVIAASDPSLITVYRLPKTWTRSRLLDDPAPTKGPATSWTADFPLNVAGRGTATLSIASQASESTGLLWQTQAGIGGIGAGAMGALLIVYRRMRSRLRAVGAIGEALVSMASGEQASNTLLVNPDLGPEAAAWNTVVAEQERMRQQGVAERVRETFGRRGQSSGDLSTVCDAMSQGLILVDDKNRVSYANGAAAAFLQSKRDELVGSDVGQFLKVNNVLDVVRQVTAGNLRRRSVMDVEQKDAESAGVLRFTIRPVRRDDAASAMLTIEDITQQKVAEAARHAFVAQATHELRTPLTNIRLYVETAIEDGENDAAIRANCLNVINGESRRLERIVGEMLSVAEIEAGSLKLRNDDVRLDTLFNELQNDYAAQARDKQIALSFNLPPKLPVALGDRDKIMLALHNLVGNALKYTPDSGKVDINVQSDEKMLSVEVRDTGIGLSPEDAEKIFERFYRARDPRVAKITGTGLGLTIAREVIRMHGGEITVDSRLNQGSAFTLTLPLKSAVAA